MSTVKNYLSLVKFSHTIFAMPFAMIGVFLGVLRPAHGVGQWNLNRSIGWGDSEFSNPELLSTFVLVLLCMIFDRSAAMAVNLLLDEKFDALNAATTILE